MQCRFDSALLVTAPSWSLLTVTISAVADYSNRPIFLSTHTMLVQAVLCHTHCTWIYRPFLYTVSIIMVLAKIAMNQVYVIAISNSTVAFVIYNVNNTHSHQCTYRQFNPLRLQLPLKRTGSVLSLFHRLSRHPKSARFTLFNSQSQTLSISLLQKFICNASMHSAQKRTHSSHVINRTPF